jgi:hypothetical protein
MICLTCMSSQLTFQIDVWVNIVVKFETQKGDTLYSSI